MSTKTFRSRQLPLPAAPAVRAEPDLRPLSMRTNFAWTLAGAIVYNACQGGMFIVLAKLGSAAMVGRFALGLAVCAPVVMFTNMHLRNVQATDARNEYRFGDYLSLRLIATSTALVVIAAIALVAGYQRADVVALLVIALAKSAESMSEVIYGLLQKWERLDLIGRSMMLKGPSSLLAFGLLIYLTRNVAWGAVGMLIAWTGLVVFYDARNARRLMRAHGMVEDLRLGSLWAAQRMPTIKRLAWLALPLGIVALLDSLSQNMPRYAIQHYLGNDSLGYYAAMAYIVVAGNMTVAALANSAQPRLSRRYIHDLPGFTRLAWKLVQFGVVLGGAAVIVALLFGRPLLAFVYTPEFARNADIFVWIMLAAGLGYVARFLVYTMTAARYLKAQAPLYAVSLAVIGALSWVLVPSYGLRGAAWASCAGMVALLLGAAAVNIHAIRARSGAESEQEPLPDLSTDLL